MVQSVPTATNPPSSPPGSYPSRTSFSRNRIRDVREKTIRGIFFAAAIISILTTAGIILSLAGETWEFFQQVPILRFLTETEWTPLFSNQQFGIWALVSATITTSVIALLIAVPLGLIAAIYLSEFASQRAREILKPALELLAGIPTVVYGFFALLFVTPLL